MTDSDQRRKRRPTLVEGFNNVPNILEEARRAVDDVTQVTQNQGGGGATPAAPEGRKGGEAGPQETKSRPPEKASHRKRPQRKSLPVPRPPRNNRRSTPTPPVPWTSPAGLNLDLADFGINGETCHPWAHPLAP